MKTPKSIEELAIEQLDPDLRAALEAEVSPESHEGPIIAALAVQMTRNTTRTANEITTLCALYDYRTRSDGT